METRSLVGRVDNVLFLKARVDNLTGHNEELRKELKETRFEAMKSNMQLDKATSKVISGILYIFHHLCIILF